MFRKTEDTLTNIFLFQMEKKLKKNVYIQLKKNKRYKTIKSYHEVVSGKADVYLDITL
jgi:hypothetical protein